MPVPLFISEESADVINTLLRYRALVGVSSSNIPFFTRGDSCFNANICFREEVNACGAEFPEDLTSTSFRKHIATVSQALNLTDSDLKVLRGVLGHTKQTHIENYRPSNAVHMARLSRLLLAFEESNIHKFRGKSIDDIEVNIEISVTLSEGEKEDERGQIQSADEIVQERTSSPTSEVKNYSPCISSKST